MEEDICINPRGNRQFELLEEINPSLQNHQGFFLYKYINHEIIKQDLDDLESDLSLNLIILSSIQETHMILHKALEHPMNFGGRNYTVTLEKQNLLSSQLGLAAIAMQAGKPFPLEWSETGGESEEWTFENLSMLAFVIAEYVRPLVNAQKHVEATLLRVESEEEIQRMMDRYRQFMDDVTMTTGGNVNEKGFIMDTDRRFDLSVDRSPLENTIQRRMG